MPVEANGNPECVETNGEFMHVDGDGGTNERRLRRYKWRTLARAGMYRRKQGWVRQKTSLVGRFDRFFSFREDVEFRWLLFGELDFLPPPSSS